FLCRISDDSKERIQLIRRSSGFMNTHPIFSSFAMGAMLRRMADEKELPQDEWQSWRENLCGPLGITGDALIWDGLKPLVFMLSFALWFFIGAPAAIVLLSVVIFLLYNAPLFILRFWGARQGWQRGKDVLQAIELPFFIQSRKWMERIGAALAGFCVIVGFIYTSDFQLVSVVQFGIGFLMLWLSIRGNWPLISSLVITVALVPLSAWFIRLLMSGGL
ncbi:PTS system mannose/fructose/sorbose family transporter subunit IID, partial [bacterium]|nr:PTS system mannose/fructose/sorbose family transporter subunit IID [bacterium]